jgi:hypothetical protein
MRKLSRAILALLLLLPAAAATPSVVYADLITADIQTPVVETFLDAPPALAPAVAVALLGHAKNAFAQTPGWDCVQPSWNPGTPAAGARLVTLRPRLWAREGGQYGGELELAFSPPGGRREAATAELPREVAEIGFAEEFGAQPEDEADPFFPSIASWVFEALNELNDRGVKPCAVKVKLHGRMLVKGTSGGIATTTRTRTWEGEGSALMVANGEVRMTVDATAQTTYESHSASGGVTVDCLGLGSAPERIRVEGSFDDTNAAVKFTLLDGADTDIRQSGSCMSHTPEMVLVPGVSSVPARDINEPLEPQGIHGLDSPGDFLGGTPISLAYGDGLKVSVPKPVRLQADEWEFTIEMVYTGHF